MVLVTSMAEAAAGASAGRSVFVPTMGALHEGHLALIRHARALGGPRSAPVVVSIFVNPTQFAPGEDFARYPRMLQKDAAAAESAGADVVFAPEAETVYPPGQVVAAPPLPPAAVEPGLEDACRPGHFAGVCQVVARLFDLVQPSIAVFGEKDYQQLIVISQMVRSEGGRWGALEIIAHPTVREADGLAMSSRNVYLKRGQRADALALFMALSAARSADSPRGAEALMKDVLESHRLAVDYAVVRDARSLMPLASRDAPARALIAARLGDVRLIDNMAWPK